ncbi:PQQ-binding-like beta-propeller repeat protein [Streptomyces sp. BF23-18]|uniref:outer membrane protein assembly factor BamB family protein n=1 Tax=Streptomyces sp. BF23-18 TaxID=3240282 RepID=UPI0034E56779
MPSSLSPRLANAFLLVAVGIAALTACSTDSGPAHVASAPTASVARPGPFGPRTLASRPPRELSSKPIAVGAGVVLTLPDDRSSLVAYDPATGAQRWKSSVRSGYAQQAWPVGSDFIVSWGIQSPEGNDQSTVGDFVARLNGRTGKPVWATRVSEWPSRGGSISFRPRAGVVLVSGQSRYSWTTALDLESGKIRWKQTDSVLTADDFDAGDFGGNYVLVYKQLDSYADTGRLMRINPSKGKALWTVALGKAYGTTVYNVRNHVVVSRRGRDGAGIVMFLEGATGKRVSVIHGAVRAHDDNIVVVSSKTGVAAYDQSGNKRWEVADLVIEDGRRAFSDGKTVYLLTGSEKQGTLSLVGLDAASGKQVTSLTHQMEAELLGTVNGFLVAESPYGNVGLIFASKPEHG